MAAIDEFYLDRLESQAVAASMERGGPLSEAAKAIINKVAWQWFALNGNKLIIRKRILWWKIELRWSDLEEGFAAVFGPRPLPSHT